MSPITGRRGRDRLAVLLASAALIIPALAGCSAIKAIHKVETTVHGNEQVIGLFTTSLKSGQPATFEATYTTTGSSPSRVVYAVRPPNQLAFTDSQPGPSAAGSGVGNFELIVNSSGEFLCTRPASGSAAWACQKLPKSGTAAERTLLGFYTPAHWVNFLKSFSLAAGFAGDKISTSTTTVHGFAMQCVDFVASGVPGTSRICTTAQHLLGFVQVAGDSTGFEITSYRSSPSGALFDLPAGAKVTTSTGSS
jgi:hypothetical protein